LQWLPLPPAGRQIGSDRLDGAAMTDRFRLLSTLVPVLVLAACASSSVTCERSGAVPANGAVVYVIDHGWHTDIGVPAAELSGPISLFREVFPGARAFVFSYGKRTFMEAPAGDWAEYSFGPLPGPATILVTGLGVAPDGAYDHAPTVMLALSPGGARALSEFLWHEFQIDQNGRPALIDRGPFPGSLFYAAARGYTLAHTCNAWSAEALEAAGVGVRPAGVVFAHQIMDRARAAALCRVPTPDGTARGED